MLPPPYGPHFAVAGLVTGQAPPDQPPGSPPIFGQIISRVTGENGYEELVLAADTFRASRYYDKAQEAGTTLAFKREVLADRQVARLTIWAADAGGHVLRVEAEVGPG